jgi:hypothetical protein
MGKKPNWRNEEDYAFTENLTAAGWAWEFLRRNPEYRADFNFVTTWLDPFFEKIFKKKREKALKLFPILARYEEHKMSGSDRERLLDKYGHPFKLFMSYWRTTFVLSKYEYYDFYKERWGVRRPLPDPNKDCDNRAFTRLSRLKFPVRITTYDDLNDNSIEYFINIKAMYAQDESESDINIVRPDRAIFVFNLSTSLLEQLKEAKSMLKDIQKDRKKAGEIKLITDSKHISKDKLRIYLRCLDAKANNASSTEIAKTIYGFVDSNTKYVSLYPFNQKAYDDLKTAEYRTTLEGYWALFCMGK